MKKLKELTSFQIILLSFAGVIILGTLLLMLPFATAGDGGASFGDALFTATSATCVTGLVVQDTATYWSWFGQGVILLLIQIGGLGVVSVAACIVTLSGKRLSVMQRSTLQDSISAHQAGGIAQLIVFILKGTLLVEVSGMLLLLPPFCRAFGWKGIWMAVFHGISAFCNAGFDLMGGYSGKFSSLTAWSGNGWVTAVICLLIVLGGIGFLTWEDIAHNGLCFRRYRLQTKLVLVTTGVLLLVPALLYFFVDFARFPLGERICQSVFQAVTPRTAGFNTADLTQMTGVGRAVMIGLMLVGGCPGSTAGGMKVTTLAVLVLNCVAVFRKQKNSRAFGRRIEEDTVRTAAALGCLYVLLSVGTALVISTVEGLPMGSCLFETASAAGTVGMTLGITPGLGILSRSLLIGLMFFGRVGGLTLIYSTFSKGYIDVSRYPKETVTVG